MPPPTPFSSNNQHPPYPTLCLYPLNDSFVPKHISLLHSQRIKIGRQTNAKTAPGERNSYFDSKVLSRQHAEVWEESNKVRVCPYHFCHSNLIRRARFSSRMSRARMALLSTANSSVLKVLSLTHSNHRVTISSYIPFTPFIYFT